MKIANPQGTWYTNTAMHAFNDPDSMTVFEPGIPTKATPTEWLKGQPVIKEIPDPLAAPKQAEKPKTSKP
jgi:hypothetical protein